MTLSAFAKIRQLSGDTSLAASVARFNLAHPDKQKPKDQDRYDLVCAANTRARYSRDANGSEITEARVTPPDSGQMWVEERFAPDFFPKPFTGDSAVAL